MMIHPRSEWADYVPRTLGWLGRRYVVFHWTAGPTAEQQQRYGTPSLMEGMEAYHMRNGGYAIFYNFVVDQDGEIWEGRGFDMRGGAQGVYDSDKQDLSVAVILGPGETPSAAMLEALEEVWRMAEDRGWDAGRRGHTDFKNKACPGPDIYEWVLTPIVEDEMAFTPEQEHTLKELVRAIDEMGSSGYGYKYTIELVRRERTHPIEDVAAAAEAANLTALNAAAHSEAAHERLNKLHGV